MNVAARTTLVFDIEIGAKYSSPCVSVGAEPSRVYRMTEPGVALVSVSIKGVFTKPWRLLKTGALATDVNGVEFAAPGVGVVK